MGETDLSLICGLFLAGIGLFAVCHWFCGGPADKFYQSGHTLRLFDFKIFAAIYFMEF
jgi:hypothetical protein